MWKTTAAMYIVSWPRAMKGRAQVKQLLLTVLVTSFERLSSAPILDLKRFCKRSQAFWEGDLCFIAGDLNKSPTGSAGSFVFFQVMDLARGGDLHGKLEPGLGLGPECSSRCRRSPSFLSKRSRDF